MTFFRLIATVIRNGVGHALHPVDGHMKLSPNVARLVVKRSAPVIGMVHSRKVDHADTGNVDTVKSFEDALLNVNAPRVGIRPGGCVLIGVADDLKDKTNTSRQVINGNDAAQIHLKVVCASNSLCPQ